MVYTGVQHCERASRFEPSAKRDCTRNATLAHIIFVSKICLTHAVRIVHSGGWCYHDPPVLPEDNQCFYRAYGPAIESNTPPGYLGSSRMLRANYSSAPPRGFSYYQSADPQENPAMHNYSFACVRRDATHATHSHQPSV